MKDGRTKKSFSNWKESIRGHKATLLPVIVAILEVGLSFTKSMYRFLTWTQRVGKRNENSMYFWCYLCALYMDFIYNINVFYEIW